MKIYTRGGDAGETSLLGGDRVPKNDPRIEAYGSIDELNSTLGVVRAVAPELLSAELEQIQNDLFDIGAQLAAPRLEDRFPGVSSGRVAALESLIDTLESELEPLRNFILPGGTVAAAHLHVARTVCRRAERCIVSLGETSSDATRRTITYVNRLSDALFVFARVANRRAGVRDVEWRPSK